MGYSKTITISELSRQERSKLKGLIFRLGYDRSDFRIVEYDDYSAEMKILNKELHRDMRTIRKTTYKGKK